MGTICSKTENQPSKTNVKNGNKKNAEELIGKKNQQYTETIPDN